MKAKNKVILGSALAIAMSASMIAGTTFALFTSESSVNIAVTSAKVEVVATVQKSTLKLASMGVEQSGNQWELGGTAGFTDESMLELTSIAPGDSATFDISIENKSSIDIKYIVECTASGALADALEYTVDGADSAWAYWSISDKASKTVSVSVELPEGTDNIYQEQSAAIALTVKAVQGNATVEDGSNDKLITVYTAKDLNAFSAAVAAGNNFSGKTVKLMNDIDLAGVAFTPVGALADNSTMKPFSGTFDGNGKTISNLYMNGVDGNGAYAATAFIAYLQGTVKDLTLDGVEIHGTHWVGGIAGYCTDNCSLNITNCTVKNAKISASVEWLENKAEYDNGDKVGGIAGYIGGGDRHLIKGCSVENAEISGYRHIGSIGGYCNILLTDCSVKNVVLTQDFTNGYKTLKEVAGSMNSIAYTSSDQYGTGNKESCTAENVEYKFVVANEDELNAVLQAINDIDLHSGTITLSKDIEIDQMLYIAGEVSDNNVHYPLIQSLVLDGNGHTVSASENFHEWRYPQGGTNGQYHLLKVDKVDNVTIQNITLKHSALENAQFSYQTLDIYQAKNIQLNNITLYREGASNKGGAALVVNGSEVTVTGKLDVHVTYPNAWYGINVDKEGAVLDITEAQITFDNNGAPLNLIHQESVNVTEVKYDESALEKTERTDKNGNTLYDYNLK